MMSELRAALAEWDRYDPDVTLQKVVYQGDKMAKAIRAYLEAAPSPSPAPGVVEQTLADLEANLDDAISYLVDLAGAKPSPMSPMNCRIYLDHARMEARRLASLSQPAKGEREAMFRVFLKSKEDDTAFTFATKPEMDAFLKAHRAAPDGWDVTDIHEYQCSTATSALDALHDDSGDCEA